MPGKWSVERASSLLRLMVRDLRFTAKHLHENRDDYSADEEEFTLGLSQGAGYPECDIAAWVRQIKGESGGEAEGIPGRAEMSYVSVNILLDGVLYEKRLSLDGAMLLNRISTRDCERSRFAIAVGDLVLTALRALLQQCITKGVSR